MMHETGDGNFITKFENGIQVIYRYAPSAKAAHCGYTLDIGGRDDPNGYEGLAHFWEHMAFKGTKKRKAFHIINRLESVGGEINAYTTKDKISFYASFLPAHFERATELLTDIVFHSTFPDKEILREKSVVEEELAMYRDTPEDAILDEFDSEIFPDHSLGNNLLGTEKSLERFSRDVLLNFVESGINTGRCVFAGVGPMKPEKFFLKARKYLESITKRSHELIRLKPKELTKTFYKEKEMHFKQAFACLGGRGTSIYDEERYALLIALNVLGGPNMNSRLNMNLREKTGLVYQVEINTGNFTDCGIFSIMFGTDIKKLPKAISLVQKEIKKMIATPLGSLQLAQAKEQLKGGIALAQDNNINVMLSNSKRLLDKGTLSPTVELYKKIDEVSADDIIRSAEKFLGPDNISTLIYKPA